MPNDWLAQRKPVLNNANACKEKWSISSAGVISKVLGRRHPPEEVVRLSVQIGDFLGRKNARGSRLL